MGGGVGESGVQRVEINDTKVRGRFVVLMRWQAEPLSSNVYFLPCRLN